MEPILTRVAGDRQRKLARTWGGPRASVVPFEPMFHWLTERRRKHLLETPFPPAWVEIIDDNVAIASKLDADQRKHLHDLAHVFAAEKHWEGCGGLELTDEMRAVISALAGILILARDHSLYEDVDSILVYPDTMSQPARPPAVLHNGVPVLKNKKTLLGEAHIGGPVLLAWNDVITQSRAHGGRNVVLHELAHKIDMADGSIDGTPPLESASERHRWAAICTQHFLELREHADRGEHTFLRAYGATNEAEFFAVATEAYFLRGPQLREHHAALYQLLADFYRVELA